MDANDFCLIVDNDQSLLHAFLFAARTRGLNAESAEAFAFVLCDFRPMSTMAREITTLCFARVDWSEVANHYNLKVAEGASA